MYALNRSQLVSEPRKVLSRVSACSCSRQNSFRLYYHVFKFTIALHQNKTNTFTLFNSHTLGQIPWLIHISAESNGTVISVNL